MEEPDPPPPPPQAARRKTPIATVTVAIHLIWIMHFTSLSGPAPTGAGPLQQTSHGLSEKPPLILQAGARLLAGFRLLYSAGDPTQRDPFDVCNAG